MNSDIDEHSLAAKDVVELYDNYLLDAGTAIYGNESKFTQRVDKYTQISSSAIRNISEKASEFVNKVSNSVIASKSEKYVNNLAQYLQRLQLYLNSLPLHSDNIRSLRDGTIYDGEVKTDVANHGNHEHCVLQFNEDHGNFTIAISSIRNHRPENVGALNFEGEEKEIDLIKFMISFYLKASRILNLQWTKKNLILISPYLFA